MQNQCRILIKEKKNRRISFLFTLRSSGKKNMKLARQSSWLNKFRQKYSSPLEKMQNRKKSMIYKYIGTAREKKIAFIDDTLNKVESLASAPFAQSVLRFVDVINLSFPLCSFCRRI